MKPRDTLATLEGHVDDRVERDGVACRRGNLQSAHTTDVELNLGCAHWAIRIIRGRSATESSGREVIEIGGTWPPTAAGTGDRAQVL